jgi:carbon-monoxide dehydrogenase medium subunit
MAPDEILTEVRVPAMPANTAANFIKLGHRRSMAISIVNLCTRLTLTDDTDDNQTILAARIALGAVSPTVIRAVAAEDLLTGQVLSNAYIDQAAKEAQHAVSPITDVRSSSGYRQRMTGVLVRRALLATRDSLRMGIPNE